MNQLIPCPECQRHVRTSETSCPFCGQALSLSNVPAPSLPRSRLGRAATFAFGATLVGATALLGCGGKSESKKEGEGGTASGGASAGTGVMPHYGAPPAGAGNDTGGVWVGGVGLLYGAPGNLVGGAADSDDNGGNSGVPPK
jgi:hypothetical protein